MDEYPFHFIFKTINRDGSIDWSFAGPKYQRQDYRKPEIDMGTVEVTEEDIKNYEDNIKLNQDLYKYNI